MVDYTTQSVDLMIDKIGGTLSYMSLLKPKSGLILSNPTVPSGTPLKKIFPQVPSYPRVLLDVLHWYYQWRVGRWSVNCDCVLVTDNLQDLAEKVRPVVGKTVKLDDLKAVREGCHDIYKTYRGGRIGKLVIEIS